MNKQPLPPPLFTCDPSDMAALDKKIQSWEEYARLPQLELAKVLVSPDAIFDLPRELGTLLEHEQHEVLLVMDQTPMLREGEQLKPLVQGLLRDAGHKLNVLMLEGDEHGLVHPDFKQVELVYEHINTGTAVIALGSGVVTDITKHASFLYDQAHADEPPVPLIFCQTANSVPVYASRMAVISKDGVKRTWPSRLANIIISDTKTLQASPVEYTLGGVGDTSPMFTAFADWYLGDYFGMASYLQASRDILSDVNRLMLPYSEEIGHHSPAGMEVMAKVLTQAGLSMTYARESAPMSGYEHVVSHMLDMSAEHHGRSTANHGSQVGVAAILHLIGFGWLLDQLQPGQIDIDRCYPSFADMEKRVMQTFAEIDPTGAMGAECWSDYRQKLEQWHGARPRFEAFLDDWDNQKQKLDALILRARDYVVAYEAAGHPLLFEELNVPIPEEQARWAYHNAHLMRKRFSHGDLLNYLGWFDEAWTDRVFDELHRLVAEARR